MALAQYSNNMNRIYLKQLIKEVIQEFEISNDDIDVDEGPTSFKEIMDQVGIDYSSIEIDGIDERDAPDFVDTYVSYAERDSFRQGQFLHQRIYPTSNWNSVEQN